ncbi:hypothetical protein [Algoriphagus sp.]|uniref:hypothetical protein n=1 Tax=Algoriphagus sp. TaxID=1872435 RepID=UPI003F704FE7
MTADTINKANSTQGENRIYRSINKFADKTEMSKRFARAKKKLFDINKWSKLPGITSSFQLYDVSGEKKLADKPEINDYIKINLPGPFPENWVIISNIQQDEYSAEFTVHPSNKPEAKGKNDKKTEHFFVQESSSTFKVECKGEILYGYEIGKNEMINNEGKEAAGRKVINTLIAEGGWAGFQKFQWEKLTDYFVHKTEIEK